MVIVVHFGIYVCTICKNLYYQAKEKGQHIFKVYVEVVLKFGAQYLMKCFEILESQSWIDWLGIRDS